MKKILIPFFIALLTYSCGQTQNKTEIKTNQSTQLEKAYFAAGCFWCVEAIFESVNGVEEVISGYAGGTQKNPTYQKVSYGLTDHAEAVEVIYDPKKVSFKTLVEVFYGSHDPTTLNRQGPDKGKQYRSIAFYSNEKEEVTINMLTKELNQSTFDGKIVTQIQQIETFYKAEDYHQNYERLNPENPYVQNVSIPRLNRFKKKFPHLLKH
ncbi:peptide-methionine (S)-S-oxide reductase MsrA [Pseudofulvibacter geojedonensis]|uniref:Peptide methionine sulfoxide reductase MsrA n=1 Tax=Pseudofulvibacter geojedonensis TaxID=1123758 RepID=A0ABW3I0L8_9FLAO